MQKIIVCMCVCGPFFSKSMKSQCIDLVVFFYCILNMLYVINERYDEYADSNLSLEIDTFV